MSKMINRFEIIEGFPESASGNYVDWDNYSTGKSGDFLWTPGLGPCFALTLYSPQQEKGILAHLTQGQKDEIPEYMLHQNVVDHLVSELGNNTPLEATLAGESQGKIGASEVIKERLRKLKIPIIGEDLGIVPIGREVHLDCATGKVTIYRYQ